MNALLARRAERFLLADIYPVITPGFCAGREMTAVLEEVIRGGARVVQLRAKAETARWAGIFREMTARAGVLLIINDCLSTALETGADGVHLGQSDLPADEARKRAPELLVGVSTHGLEQALEAERKGASYVNIGPIFPTSTKKTAVPPLGVGAIRLIGPRLGIPFTVMGGINAGNLDLVLEAGARRVAMVTALTGAPDITAETRRLAGRIRDRAGGA